MYVYIVIMQQAFSETSICYETYFLISWKIKKILYRCKSVLCIYHSIYYIVSHIYCRLQFSLPIHFFYWHILVDIPQYRSVRTEISYCILCFLSSMAYCVSKFNKHYFLLFPSHYITLYFAVYPPQISTHSSLYFSGVTFCTL